MTDFDRATAVVPVGDGRFTATFDPAWNTPRGPNGGFVAAIVLRAMLAALDADEPRPPRSLTVHFLRPPGPDEATIEVVTERAGRSLTSLSARLIQDGRLMVVALGAFAGAYPSAIDYGYAPPEVRAFEDSRPTRNDHPSAPPIGRKVEVRPVLGGRLFTEHHEAVSGGWLRLAEPRPLDPVLLAFYSDAWMPAPYVRLPTFAPAPTIDLTIHFRASEAGSDDGRVLTRFVSRTSAEGFFEEDGELWAPDGTLVAQSRQLALLLPIG